MAYLYVNFIQKYTEFFFIFVGDTVRSLSYLIRSERNFSAASGATPDRTIVTNVAHPVGELGLEAYVACGVKFHSRLFLLFVAGSDGFL